MIPAHALPGDFFLVSFDGENPNISNLNRWFTHGGLIRIGQWANGDGFAQYEHAGIYVGNIGANGKIAYDSPKIIEAMNTGTGISDAHRYDGNDTLWSTGLIPLSNTERRAIVSAAFGYVGTPYSWPDYAALAAYRLKLGLLVPKLKDYVASTKHMICSQVVDQCYEDANVHLFDDGRWPGYVTPGSLRNLLYSKMK